MQALRAEALTTETDVTDVNFGQANVDHFSHSTDGTRVGAQVSGAGDLNGDGYQDFIVGAAYGSSGGDGTFVVFGDDRATLNALPTNLDELTNLQGFRFSAGSQVRYEGYSISSAGDFNGDGYDDLIVGAPETNETSSGYAGIVFGKASGWSDLVWETDLQEVSNPTDSNTYPFLANGLSIIAYAKNAGLGHSVSGGGDVNGDGLDDVVVSSNHQGYAFILFGTTDPKSLIAERLGDFGVDSSGGLGRSGVDPGDQGVEFLSDADGDGVSLVGKGVLLSTTGALTGQIQIVGDVNGDGYDDILVGDGDASITGAIPDDTGAGQGYLIYGQDFQSGDGPIATVTVGTNVTESSNGQALVGTSGDDDLSAGAQSEVSMRGGAGDDTFHVDLDERRVDGGSGMDFLEPITGGLDFDFTALLANGSGARLSALYESIEGLKLSGDAGSNTVTLDYRDVLAMTDTAIDVGLSGFRRAFFIEGDSGDVVNLTSGSGEFNSTSPDTFDYDGETYDIYVADNANSIVAVLVDTDITTVTFS